MFLFLVYLLIKFSQNQDVNLCQTQLTCADCLRASSLCVWCKKPGFENLRCNTISNFENQACTGNDLVRIQSSKQLLPEIVNEFVRISSRKVTAVFRPGQFVEFDITVTLLKAKQVHLGIVLDNSQSMQKVSQSITDLTTNLATMSDSNALFSKIGVAQFMDKCQHPVINLEEYNNFPDDKKPFNYKIIKPLTNNGLEVKTELAKTSRTSNYDAWENVGEAILYTAVCEQFGWENNDNIARTIIVFTDAFTKSAGAGLIIGVIRPHDMRCHLGADLSDGKGLDYDYPPIPYVGYMLKQTKTEIIFAVDEKVKRAYEAIANSWKGVRSTVIGINTDSAQIQEILRETRRTLNSKIQLFYEEPEDVAVTIIPSCPQKFNTECRGVNLNIPTTFKIKVQARDIKVKTPQRFVFSVSNLGQFEFEYKLIDDCSCGDSASPPKTCASGTYKCGVCECQTPLKGGDLCQCNVADKNIHQCINGATGDICSNRGFCDACGACKCFTSPDGKPFGGDKCECSRSECTSTGGSPVCGGANRGTCGCESCECKPDYFGQNCEHEKCDSTGNRRKCKIQETDAEDCSGHGRCNCGTCICNPQRGGTHCEKEVIPVNCDLFKQSVFCELDTTVDKQSEECKNRIHTVEITEEDISFTCLRSGPSNCRFSYNYRKTATDNEEDRAYTITVKKLDVDKDCDRPVNIIVVTIGAFLGILLIGILLFVVYFICLYFYYRHEFKKFQKEVYTQKDAQENPLFEVTRTE